MSSYVEFKNPMAFHPRYFVSELIEYSGFSVEEFATRISVLPDDISSLIHGEKKLSHEIAIELSRFTGTTVEYWLNLQKRYDAAQN